MPSQTIESALILRLTDLLSQPAKGAEAGMKKLSEAQAALQKALGEAQGAEKQLAIYQRMQAGLIKTSETLDAAYMRVQKLSAGMNAGVAPTAKMTAAMEKAERAYMIATTALNRQNYAMGEQKKLIESSAGAFSTVTSAQDKIRRSIELTTAAIEMQTRAEREAAAATQRRIQVHRQFRETLGTAAMFAAIPVGHAVVKGVEAAGDIQAAQLAMVRAGMDRALIEQVRMLSIKLSAANPSVSQVDIMNIARDTRSSMTQRPQQMIGLLPLLTSAKMVLDQSDKSGGQSEGLTRLVKGMELLGAAKDPVRMDKLIRGYMRAIQVLGNTVTPEAIFEMDKYSKMAGARLSDRFLLGPAMVLTQELGGATAGVGMSMLGQVMAGSRISNQAATNLLELGLTTPGAFRINKTTGKVMGVQRGVSEPIQGSALAATDPDLWIYKYFLPALQRMQAKKGWTDSQIEGFVQRTFTNQNVSATVWKLISQREQFEGTSKAMLGAQDPEEAAKALRGSFNNAFASLGVQAGNLGGAVFGPSMGLLGTGAEKAADALEWMTQKITDLSNSMPRLATYASAGIETILAAAAAYFGWKMIGGTTDIIRNLRGGGARPGGAPASNIVAESIGGKAAEALKAGGPAKVPWARTLFNDAFMISAWILANEAERPVPSLLVERADAKYLQDLEEDRRTRAGRHVATFGGKTRAELEAERLANNRRLRRPHAYPSSWPRAFETTPRRPKPGDPDYWGPESNVPSFTAPTGFTTTPRIPKPGDADYWGPELSPEQAHAARIEHNRRLLRRPSWRAPGLNYTPISGTLGEGSETVGGFRVPGGISTADPKAVNDDLARKMLEPVRAGVVAGLKEFFFTAALSPAGAAAASAFGATPASASTLPTGAAAAAGARVARRFGGPTGAAPTGPGVTPRPMGPAGPQSGIEDEAEKFKGVSASDPAGRAKLEKYMREAGIPVNPANTAWCAAFVNATLGHQGIVGTMGGPGGLMASSFKTWGHAVAAADAQKGDVMEVKMGRGQRDPHVGIFTGRRDPKTGKYEMISGNASDSPGTPRNPAGGRSQWGQVGYAWYDPSNINFRRTNQSPGTTAAGAAPPPGVVPSIGAGGVDVGTRLDSLNAAQREAFLDAVTKQENARKGSNNPGNMYYAPWMAEFGGKPGPGGLAQFGDPAKGRAAMGELLFGAGHTYHGRSIAEVFAGVNKGGRLVGGYAPRGHGANDPETYAQHVAAAVARVKAKAAPVSSGLPTDDDSPARIKRLMGLGLIPDSKTGASEFGTASAHLVSGVKDAIAKMRAVAAEGVHIPIHAATQSVDGQKISPMAASHQSVKAAVRGRFSSALGQGS